MDINELLQELYRETLCPMCQNLPSANVSVCLKGHHVCQSCRRSSFCPWCKSKFDMGVVRINAVLHMAKELSKLPNETANLQRMNSIEQLRENRFVNERVQRSASAGTIIPQSANPRCVYGSRCTSRCRAYCLSRQQPQGRS